MGKVASSSIFSSLTKQYRGSVGHAHHISDDNWRSKILYDWAKSGKPLKIISPVREPIGRNISAFFQRFNELTGEKFEDSKYSTNQLIDLFFEKLDHDIPLLWFDKNIKNNFNIDVYQSVFPNNGIARYTNKNIELLVLRIDIDDSKKEEAISEFVEISAFKLKNKNLSEKNLTIMTTKRL